jgi:hypothetical protein
MMFTRRREITYAPLDKRNVEYNIVHKVSYIFLTCFVLQGFNAV